MPGTPYQVGNPLSQSVTQRVLIIEGGALRSVFSAGLLDGFLQRQFNPFDLCLGVSAGACNLLGYLARSQSPQPSMPASALDLYTTVARDPRFLNYRRFLSGGDLVNLPWLVDLLVERFAQSPHQLDFDGYPLVVATTDVGSGRPWYTRATLENLREVLTATMSLPLLYRQFPKLQGRPQTDGGVAANIPIAHALALGATEVMVVRSRPRDYVKRDTLAHRWIRFRLRANTELVATMQRRCEMHQLANDQLRLPPRGVRILDLSPPPDFQAGRFARSEYHMRSGYEAGLAATDDAIRDWLQMTACRE